MGLIVTKISNRMTNDMDPSSANQTSMREVRFEHSPQFPAILERLRVSVLVSTYQSGKLLVIGCDAGRLNFAFHDFDQVMGVAVGPDQLAVGTRRQVYFLSAAHECADRIKASTPHDQCWIARTSVVTGSIHGHDLAWGHEGLWVVNTLFSSLCTLSSQYNFVPRWQPPFITQLIDQDRCHLNGLAMENGVPRFVTVLGETNEPAGWRTNKASGGAIIDVPSGETVARGLCMPHSPRVHNGRLWFCNSGIGNLSQVDRQSGHVEAVAALPGYTRGLAVHDGFAFVGLSKIRETNIFGGLPISEYKDELKCGVGVVELATGRTVATLQFHSGVEEIFAVEVIAAARHPRLVGPNLTEAEEGEVWTVPARLTPIAFEAQPALTANPVDGLALARQGLHAHEQGALQEALRCYRQAIEAGQPTAELLSQLGNLHQDLDDPSAAMACYLQAAQLQPDHAPTQQNLGVLCSTQNQPQQALHHFQLAQQARPNPMNFVLAANVLPIIYESLDQLGYWRGRLVSRLHELVETGVKIGTTDHVIPTSFFFAYQGENDRPLMQNLAEIYTGVECCSAAVDGLHQPVGKRIRVGFVSSYFCNHTIGRLNLGVIQNLSRADIEVTIISLRSHQDSQSQLYRQAADHFVSIPRNPSAARRAIAELGLDVLIFTDIGMDCLTQTLCYSRMAPIQAVTWGHPDTTGSPAIDYFISSDLAEPTDADSHYSERLVRLPTLGVHYPRPQLDQPARGKAYFGLDPNRRVYLCPQTLFKFHPAFDDVLRRILESDSQGDLVVIESRNASWGNALRARWRLSFPDADRRVRFVPSQTRNDFLHLLSAADIMLDPFPFCGGNTTYEALAMATPVVTMPGKFLRGRLTYAMYQRMQMTELVAESVDAYVERSLRIATDDRYRNEIRKAIGETSGILYENRQDVTAYEQMLKRWCGRLA